MDDLTQDSGRDTKPPSSHDPSGAVHVYDDDLVEENHPMPGWWQATLYGGIAFAALYWYGAQSLHAWPSRAEAYQAEQLEAQMKSASAGAGLDDAAIVALARTPATIDKGRQLFLTTCASCHRADGGGNIGPNLTDDSWLHGGEPKEIWKTIHDGVPAKGMPTWAPQLGEANVATLAAYVVSLKGTHVAGGKAPQGEAADTTPPLPP